MISITFESAIALVRGLLIGIALAIPVGPIAVLCMRRTLERGPMYGFATGLGAALADMVYGAVAAFGIVAFSGFIHLYSLPLRLVGGTLMLILAARLARKRPKMNEDCDKATTGHKISAFISGFLLTISNPLVMAGFFAVFTGVGLGRAAHHTELTTMLVLGVGCGSALWWFILTLGVVRLRHLLSAQAMHRINLIASLVLAVFGIYAYGSVLLPWLHG